MKKTLLLSLLTTILFVSCDSNKDPFTIGEGSIGSLDKNIQMKQVDSIFAEDSIVKLNPIKNALGTQGEVEIYDKEGNALTNQIAPNPTIFPSGGCCDLTVSYDKAADRWVLTFLGGGAQIAVSDGPDPINDGWFTYTIPSVNDYQKLSVWSDGYYITDNTSNSSNRIYALERDAMLAGDPNAQVIGFPLPGIATDGFYSPQAILSLIHI